MLKFTVVISISPQQLYLKNKKLLFFEYAWSSKKGFKRNEKYFFLNKLYCACLLIKILCFT